MTDTHDDGGPATGELVLLPGREMVGGWECYIDPEEVALMRVFNLGSEFAVFANLRGNATDNANAAVRLTDTYPSKGEAMDAMDALAAEFWESRRPALREAPPLGPA